MKYGDSILFLPRSDPDGAFLISEATEYIIKLLERPRSPEELLRETTEKYGDDGSDLHEKLKTLLEEMEAAGIVKEESDS